MKGLSLFIVILSVFLFIFVIVSIMANSNWRTVCIRSGYAANITIDGRRYCFRYDESGNIDLLKFEIAKMRVNER